MIKNMVRFLAFVCCVGFAMSAWGAQVGLGYNIAGTTSGSVVSKAADSEGVFPTFELAEGAWSQAFTKVVIRQVANDTTKASIEFGKTGTQVAESSSTTQTGSIEVAVDLSSTEYTAITSSDFRNASFYVEFYYGDKVVGFSDVYSGDLLQSAISSPSSVKANSNMFVMTVTPMPEPTSGLLFLVGGALLGLRRKRRAA